MVESPNQEDIEDIDESSGSITKPFDPKDIDIDSKTFALDNIVKRIKFNNINFFTEFQRLPDLWGEEKQSQLIESLLLRLPIPQFYFDATDDSKWEVVDGLQRLSAIRNFILGNEKGQKLRLTGLEYLKIYDGRTFDELPHELQRRIEESQIIAYLIKAGTPSEVKFNLFKRINTSGLILRPQEIRHALNQGIGAEFIKSLSELNEFKKATDNAIPSKRMEDRDFITRFVAFYIIGYENYQPDLDTFLNQGMKKVASLSENDRIDIKQRFVRSMNSAFEIFNTDAFRKRYNLVDARKPINKALFDTWSVNLAKLSSYDIERLEKQKEEVKQAFIDLMNDSVFEVAISRSTGDVNSVKNRFEKIEKLIQTVLA